MVTTDKPGGNGAGSGHYRDRWKWDKVTWGSHSVDCYPGGCPFHVYVKDGKIMREEQAGAFPVIQKGVPDMNPMGCQKGNAWSQMLHSPERILYPLKRAGERGEGKWERVSWDQALTEIADATLDAIQESGPESVLQISTPNEGGLMAGMLFGRLIDSLGGMTTDVNADINDFKQLEATAGNAGADAQLLALKQKMGLLPSPAPDAAKQLGTGAPDAEEIPEAEEIPDEKTTS